MASVLSNAHEPGWEGETSHLEIGSSVSRQRPAWLLSMVLHLTLLLALGLISGLQPRRPPAEPVRTAGLALVRRDQQHTRYFSPDRAEAEAASASSSSSSPASNLPSLNRIAVGEGFALPTSPTARADGISLPLAGGLTRSNQPARKLPGGGAQTQVFGAVGVGSKFVYVFDRSASMQGLQGRPMAAAKSELVSSLRDLASVHQFQIVFYNERASVFHPFRDQRPNMMFGSDENKKLAADFVRRVSPSGATRHMQALTLALGMRPDVIFFLTDAAEPALTAQDLELIRRRNGGETAIHAIEFGAGPFGGRENFLVRLAQQNSGQHVYVDVTRLPRNAAGDR